MTNKKNTFITEDSYNNIKSTSMEITNKLTEARFDENEIKALEFGGQMFKPADTLHGSSYGHFSSFLYYHENKDSKKGIETESRNQVDEKYTKGKDWRNIDKLQDWNEIPNQKLKAGVVFIGPNAGTGAKDLSFEHFENFHNFGGAAIKKYCNSFTSEIDFYVDIKMANLDKNLLKEYGLKKRNSGAREGFVRYDKIKEAEELLSDISFFKEKIEGSYATDFIKGIPTADSSALRKHINDVAMDLYGGTDDSKTDNIYKKEFRIMTMYVDDFRKRLACAFVDILIEELELLGNITHTLIVMNSSKNSFTKEMLELGNFEEKYRDKNGNPISIEKVGHYVSPVSQHIWRYQLEEVYGRKNKSSKRMEIWADKVSKDPRFEGVEFVYKKLED